MVALVLKVGRSAILGSGSAATFAVKVAQKNNAMGPITRPFVHRLPMEAAHVRMVKRGVEQTQETIMLDIVPWNVATVRQRKYVMNMMTYTTNIARRSLTEAARAQEIK